MTCLMADPSRTPSLRSLARSAGVTFDPFGELIPQNPVLGLEVLDHLDELFLRGPGYKQQEGVDEPLHAQLVGRYEGGVFMGPRYADNRVGVQAYLTGMMKLARLRSLCGGSFLAPCSHFVANGADVGEQDGRWWNLAVA